MPRESTSVAPPASTSSGTTDFVRKRHAACERKRRRLCRVQVKSQAAVPRASESASGCAACERKCKRLRRVQAKMHAVMSRASGSASGCAARKRKCKRLCRADSSSANVRLPMLQAAVPHASESGCAAQSSLIWNARFPLLDLMLRLQRTCMRSGECVSVWCCDFSVSNKGRRGFTDEETQGACI